MSETAGPILRVADSGALAAELPLSAALWRAARAGGQVPPRVTGVLLARGPVERTRRALHGWAGQTHEPRELVVVEEGGGEALAGELLALGEPDVRHLRVEPGRHSESELLRLALREATGDLVACWDEDLLSAPERLELQVAAGWALRLDLCVLARRHLLGPGAQPLRASAPGAWADTLLGRRALLEPHLAGGGALDGRALARLARRARLGFLDAPDLAVRLEGVPAALPPRLTRAVIGLPAPDRPAAPAPSPWLARYHEINDAFRQTLVYHVGTDAGFFSEYNHLLLALLYCLRRGLRLRVSSAHANFSRQDGLDDYFLPFVAEDEGWYNRPFNLRPYGIADPAAFAQRTARIKARHGIDHFTQDLWTEIRREGEEPQHYDIPELGLRGGLLEVAPAVLEQIWRFQPAVAEEVRAAVAGLALPPDYVALHVRRGDKVGEAPPVPTRAYFERAERETDLRHAFLATDDHVVVEEARAQNPSWTISSLCRPAQQGYRQRAFERQPRRQVYDGVVALLADVEVMHAARRLFVTYSSNVGLFLGLRRGRARMAEIHSLDVPGWRT